MPHLRPFALERFFARHEFSVNHLACASDPDAWTTKELLALEPGAEAKYLALPLGYTETMGHPELRAAIAALDPGLSPADVLVHAGAEEAIYAFMHVVLSAEDHAIVHVPAYQSLYEVAQGIGAHVARWEARESQGWLPDPGELERLVTAKTKVLVLNTPHNPTGAHLPRAFLDAAITFARRHGLWLFSDEVYRGLEYGAPRHPPVATLYERGVSLGATAKVYGLAGLRIGWVACRDHALLERLATFKDYLTICSAGPSEFLATVAMRHAGTLAGRSRAIVTENLARVDELFARRPDVFQWVRPVAGTTAFPRLVRGEATAFTERLLADTGVLLMPGPLFDFDDAHVRLGLGRRSLAQALPLLDEWLSRQA
ncbi:MAG: aminotransferase class I/II-fold pyridoxal phosphate-dependent enzyme [Myxococcota bacterium]